MRSVLGDRAIVLFVAAAAAMAVAVRLAWQLRSGFYEGPRTFEEDEIARNVLTGRGYVHQFLGTERVTFGLPAFPLILVALHILDGGPDQYRLIGLTQAGLSAITVVAAYLMGSGLLSRTGGVLAAWAVALHPGLIFYAAVAVFPPVYEHALAAVVFVAALTLLHQRTGMAALAFGATTALAIVLRPNVAAGAALALVGMALRPPRAALVLAATIPLAVVLATSARNALAVGQATPTPTLCMQMWVGNNPHSLGGAVTADGTSVFDAMEDDLRSRVYGRPEAEQEAAFCAALRDFFSDVPRAAVWQLQKFYYFWWFSPAAGVMYPPGVIEVYRFVYALEVVLVIVGSLAVWRHGSRDGLLTICAIMIAISLVQALFYVDGRHRLIVEPALAALAGCGLVRIVSLARRGRTE